MRRLLAGLVAKLPLDTLGRRAIQETLLDWSHEVDGAKRGHRLWIHWMALVSLMRALIGVVLAGRLQGAGVDAPRLVATSMMEGNMKRLMMLLVVLGAAVGFAVATLTPARYRSEAVLVVVPHGISTEYVPNLVTQRLEERLQAIMFSVLSRTKLTRIIEDVGLYAEERQTGTMEDVVARMRQNIEVRVSAPMGLAGPGPGNGVVVGFAGDDPTTVQRVAERLAVEIIETNLMSREMQAEGTVGFLESRITDLRNRLDQRESAVAKSPPPASRRADTLEVESLEAGFTALLAKRELAQLQISLERRQLGEQLRLLDHATLPERPINPSRAQVTALGALVGLAVGLALGGVLTGVRAWRSARHTSLVADGV